MAQFLLPEAGCVHKIMGVGVMGAEPSQLCRRTDSGDSEEYQSEKASEESL